MTLTAGEWLALGIGLGSLTTVVSLLAWAAWGVKRNDRNDRNRGANR